MFVSTYRTQAANLLDILNHHFQVVSRCFPGILYIVLFQTSDILFARILGKNSSLPFALHFMMHFKTQI